MISTRKLLNVSKKPEYRPFLITRCFPSTAWKRSKHPGKHRTNPSLHTKTSISLKAKTLATRQGFLLCYNINMKVLVTRGVSIYKIVMKNKLIMSIMMLVNGILMSVAAFQGKGNDTKTMPTAITAAGAVLLAWTIYKFWREKSIVSRAKASGENAKEERKNLIFLGLESVLYLGVTIVGIFLLFNEDIMSKILNLMAGFFTSLNGILGLIRAYKQREEKDTVFWRFMMTLTVLELIIGPYFIFGSDSISTPGFAVMGVLTAIAGLIEVISSLSFKSITSTYQDGKDIVKTLKEK